jgi:hypothetical protein
MKRAMIISAVLFVVVGVCAFYWTRATTGNAFAAALSFCALFFGIVATGGIHADPAYFPLFAVSWIGDSLALIFIAEVIARAARRRQKS